MTGDPGKNGPGVVQWDASAEPPPNVGIDGDMWRHRDGRWWVKDGGVWVLQQGTLGKSGSRVIPIEGDGPPERPTDYDPPAEEGDYAFAKRSHRFYHLVRDNNGRLVWIEFADLSPNRVFLFSDRQGQPPNSATLVIPDGVSPPDNDDEARNIRTGEIWRYSDGNWAAVGDATRAGGISLGAADFPVEDGAVFGQIYISTTSPQQAVRLDGTDRRHWQVGPKRIRPRSAVDHQREHPPIRRARRLLPETVHRRDMVRTARRDGAQDAGRHDDAAAAAIAARSGYRWLHGADIRIGLSAVR